MINIKGLSRADVLAALFNGASGPTSFEGEMSRGQAQDFLNQNGGRLPPPNDAYEINIDFVYGRPIHVAFVGDELRFESIYDLNAGEYGTVRRIIEGLRVKAAEVAAAWKTLLRGRPAALMTMTVSNDSEEDR